MTKKILVSASTHPCPFGELTNYIDELRTIGVDYLHCDLMDGNFVDDVALDYDKIVQIGQISTLPLDIHLMASSPLELFDACLEANAEYVTVHIESFADIAEAKMAIGKLKNDGIKAGITLNPSTNISAIEPLLEYVDLVLVMSVVPGKSGQSFMLQSVERISELNRLRNQYGYGFLIEVDGGINATTAPLAINAGADILVSGSYLYRASDKADALKKLGKDI